MDANETESKKRRDKFLRVREQYHGLVETWAQKTNRAMCGMAEEMITFYDQAHRAPAPNSSENEA